MPAPTSRPNPPHGLVVVISGPSGAGKTTVARLLVERCGCLRSVSATTRPVRPGEEDGVAYHFLSRDAFLAGVKRGDFLEHSEHFGNLYGTPRKAVEEALRNGRTILLEIDVVGAAQVIERVPPESRLTIFLSAPDMSENERRLRDRHSEPEAGIRARLQRADMEIAAQMRYDNRIVNDRLEDTVARIHSLIQQAEARNANGR